MVGMGGEDGAVSLIGFLLSRLFYNSIGVEIDL